MRRSRTWTTLLVGSFTLVAFANVGCSTMDNTERGAAIGGAGGAVAGSLIGAATRNPVTGAVVGALGGAVLGGAIGNDMDRTEAKNAAAQREQAYQQASAQYAAAQPERMAQIVALVRQGQTETVIINYIRTNQMQFRLSVADLDYLKTNAVPERIIAEMQATVAAQPVAPPSAPPSPPQTVVVREQVVYPGYGPFYGGPAVIVTPRPHYYRRW